MLGENRNPDPWNCKDRKPDQGDVTGYNSALYIFQLKYRIKHYVNMRGPTPILRGADYHQSWQTRTEWITTHLIFTWPIPKATDDNIWRHPIWFTMSQTLLIDTNSLRESKNMCTNLYDMFHNHNIQISQWSMSYANRLSKQLHTIYHTPATPEWPSHLKTYKIYIEIYKDLESL